MGVFKYLNRSDVFLTDYLSRKRWKVSGSELESLGVEHIKAYSGSAPLVSQSYYSPRNGTFEGRLLYRNLYQSYYSGSLASGAITGSVDLNLQTTITSPNTRQLPESDSIYHPLDEVPFVDIFSVPSNITGVYLDVGSVALVPKADELNYVVDGYVQEETVGRKDKYYFENFKIGESKDREGALVASGYGGSYEINPEGFDYPRPSQCDGEIIGDVIYNQGLIIVTDPFWAWMYSNYGCEELRFTSNIPIHTYNINCRVLDHEFNLTYNKTAKDIVGTEDFTPYITGVGLYNNRNELIAIAKLSKPIKKEDNIDMTFNIRLDLT